jgi:hypothetical protein
MDDVLGGNGTAAETGGYTEYRGMVTGVSDRPGLMDAISCRGREVSEDAYGALRKRTNRAVAAG